MLTIAYALLLTQGSFQPAHATLLGEPVAFGTGILLAQEQAAPPVPTPPRTLQEMRAEYDRLDQSRPSLGGSIAMLAVGAGLCLGGLVFGLYGAAISLSTLFTPYGSAVLTALAITGFVFLGIAVVFLAVGIPLAVVGGRKLAATIRERNAIGAKMNEVEQQMQQLEQLQPPPAPPPMSVEREQGPRAMAVVASF